ncbi:SSI family serine proteinase inhibitor [Streptomyces sp. DSM 44917]|uniref:SSI family serine proteinase inhibitor n=1 Tax=Streptomyces boetiae TaxID=3075541 RepID=A0ABU2LCM2_9ACTN|nr:SSI family serine proteinase inhibitor [Streptomyces sp. DSM 44917]MDT0309267.1 SSI family serine proteinase inhibitor [Streptomyces sp. DSM 44917]
MLDTLGRSLAVALTLVGGTAGAAGAAGPTADPAAAEDVNELVITVAGTGGSADGTFRLSCAPAGAEGEHPDPAAACGAVEEAEAPFEPVSEGTLCTYVYGGAATARVTGTWAGEEVRAEFSRENGCEIERWDALVPALPDLGDGDGQEGQEGQDPA